MKKAIYLGLLIFLAYSTTAQSDTSNIEQYCQIIATPKLFSNKVTIDIDFGQEKSYWRDSRLKTYDGNIKKFNTIIDALNFMGKEGWVFINAYPVRYNNTEIYHFAFKKLFKTSDFVAAARNE